MNLTSWFLILLTSTGSVSVEMDDRAACMKALKITTVSKYCISGEGEIWSTGLWGGEPRRVQR